MKNKNLLLLSILALVVVVLTVFSYTMKYENTPSRTYEKEITRIEKTSDSDDVDSIEQDLEDTDLENIDAELTDIEAELK